MTTLILKGLLEQLVIINIILISVIISLVLINVIINVIIDAVLLFNKKIIYPFNMSFDIMKSEKSLYGEYSLAY